MCSSDFFGTTQRYDGLKYVYQKPECCRGNLRQECTPDNTRLLFYLQIKCPAFQIKRKTWVAKRFFWCCCFLFWVNPLCTLCTGNLNDWAPEGPFCSYRRHRITHHALRRKIAFPRTACPPSAVPRAAADCSAKLRYTVLECCRGATQIAMTQLLQYRRHSEGGSSFVSSCCVLAKVTAAAANDLWSASINIT